jgi:hypothetical protein
MKIIIQRVGFLVSYDIIILIIFAKNTMVKMRGWFTKQGQDCSLGRGKENALLTPTPIGSSLSSFNKTYGKL